MRSILFNLYFFVINAALFIFGLPVLLMGRPAILWSMKFWAKCIVYGAKYIAGIDYEIRGNIPQTPVIYASKHQSAWETAFFLLLPYNPVFILKKELLYIPLFGLYLSKGKHIAINRSSGALALKKMLVDVKDRTTHDRSIVIFPEGTRVKPGATSDIKPGIIAIYNHVDVPIIPVSLNSGNFWGRNSFFKKPGKIIVEFGDEIPKNLNKEEFISALKQHLR